MRIIAIETLVCIPMTTLLFLNIHHQHVIIPTHQPTNPNIEVQDQIPVVILEIHHQ